MLVKTRSSNRVLTDINLVINVSYCSRECQKADYVSHKSVCMDRLLDRQYIFHLLEKPVISDIIIDTAVLFARHTNSSAIAVYIENNTVFVINKKYSTISDDEIWRKDSDFTDHVSIVFRKGDICHFRTLRVDSNYVNFRNIDLSSLTKYDDVNVGSDDGYVLILGTKDNVSDKDNIIKIKK